MPDTIPIPPRICLLMMVRNGGELFRQALKSAMPFVDDAIILNTDEEAQTPDVTTARSMGAQVAHSPWCGDFSVHRNELLKLAEQSRPACEWAFMLDADEKLVGLKDADSLRRALASIPEDVHVASLAVYDLLTNEQGGDVVTMFNNQQKIQRIGKTWYEGRVHEKPLWEGGKKAFLQGLVLHHYGYDPLKTDIPAKIKRSRDLLHADWEEGTEGPITAFYLCQNYGMAGEVDEALKWGRRYLERKDEIKARGEQFHVSVYYSLAMTELGASHPDEARKLAEEGLAERPDYPDLWYALALAHEGGAGNTREQLQAWMRYLECYDAMTASRAGAGVIFVFTHNETSLINALARVAALSVGVGKRALDVLDTTIPKTGELPDPARKRLNKAFEKTGALDMLPPRFRD